MGLPLPGGRVLVTKLYPPSAESAALLPRALPDGVRGGGGRLILLCAPAGASKTTQLRALWQQRGAGGAAWLSLDAGDNASGRFLAHLVAAIAVARPTACREANALLQGSEQVEAEQVLSLLVNGLAGEAAPLLICLDDYHEIVAPAVHHLMRELLRYLPPEVCLAIASRREPPLALGQLRARGGVVELDWEDLHFSPDEAVAFLTRTRGLPLCSADAEALAAQTEGWPAGLQLVALALARGTPAAAVLGDHGGRETRLREFLLETVWDSQTEAVREFLLATAQLERFCEPLCATLLPESGAALFDHVLQHNLFVFRLHDDSGLGWCRYHHLFRDFLRSRWQLEAPQRANAYLLAAARWCARHADPREALDYALRAEAWDFAADWLLNVGRAWFLQSDAPEIDAALASLPEDVVRVRPRLFLLHAWIRLYLGDNRGAEDCLQRLSMLACGDAGLAAEAQVLQVVIGVVDSDMPDLTRWNPDLIAALPQDDREIRAFGAAAQGYVARAEGHLAEARAHFLDAIALTEDCSSPNAHLVAAYNVALLDWLAGDMPGAESDARAYIARAEADRGRHVCGIGYLRVVEALACFDQDHLPQALAAIEQAVETLRLARTYSYLGIALAARALFRHAAGDQRGAESDLAEAGALARQRQIQRVAMRVDLVAARIDPLRSDCPDIVCRWRDKVAGEVAGKATGEVAEQLGIEMGWLDVQRQAAGLPAATGISAETLLTLAAGAEKQGRRRIAAELNLLAAALLQRAGGDARQAIAAGERLARAGGMNRLLAHPPSPLEAMRRPDAAARPPHGSGVAPLRQREMQILRLLEQGLGNRDIAAKLFISETTVKWYLQHLYAALGVSRRTAAVAEARQRGLLC